MIQKPTKKVITTLEKETTIAILQSLFTAIRVAHS
jgi:hypothetical protein